MFGLSKIVLDCHILQPGGCRASDAGKSRCQNDENQMYKADARSAFILGINVDASIADWFYFGVSNSLSKQSRKYGISELQSSQISPDVLACH